MCIDRVWPRRALRGPLVALILTLLAGSVPARAQSKQLPPPARPPRVEAEATAAAAAALPSARSIIDRHVQAIGGREAILRHSSTHATGVLSIPSAGMTGSIEMFAAKPNKAALKITINGVGEVREGFDGTTAWSLSPMSGPMVLEGKQLEEKRFDVDFYAELHEDGRYESMTTVEKTAFEGRPCYKLRLVRRGGGEDIEYYDAQTGLKAGSTTTRETPMGTVTATTVESGYRKFGDILQPASIRQTVMGLQQLITVTNIEYDAVPDSAFDLPAPIKALTK